MVEAAGVEPDNPHGWCGFTHAWATQVISDLLNHLMDL